MAAMMASESVLTDEAIVDDPVEVTRLRVVTAAEDPAVGEQDEKEFRSFGLAIVLGILIGIPVLAALVAAGVKVAAPDTDPVAIFGIALWVSLFCGPFLAGTVTVGLWASRQH